MNTYTKPMWVAPRIQKTIIEHGIRMYVTTAGLYVADTYDKMFKVAKGTVLPRKGAISFNTPRRRK